VSLDRCVSVDRALAVEVPKVLLYLGGQHLKYRALSDVLIGVHSDHRCNLVDVEVAFLCKLN
jgi:hypothetical protein